MILLCKKIMSHRFTSVTWCGRSLREFPLLFWSCSCLALLPHLACSILATWEHTYSGALYACTYLHRVKPGPLSSSLISTTAPPSLASRPFSCGNADCCGLPDCSLLPLLFRVQFAPGTRLKIHIAPTPSQSQRSSSEGLKSRNYIFSMLYKIFRQSHALLLDPREYVDKVTCLLVLGFPKLRISHDVCLEKDAVL